MTNTCFVCDAVQDGQRSFCGQCGGLTALCRKDLAPYEPVDLLVRWEAGSLYRGKIVLDLPAGDEPDKEESKDSPEVWIFTYDEEIVHTPALIRLQQEDRKLAQLPHPNLPKQLDRGYVGHRPYLIFEGQPMALPMPTWRPNLPNHVLSSIFSRLAELVLLLQSAGIQRPVIDPFRLMVFWNEESDLLDFRWLPLPELGNYLYREGFAPTQSKDSETSPQAAAVPPMLHHLADSQWTTRALYDAAAQPDEPRVTRGPMLPEDEEEGQRETTVIQKFSELEAAQGAGGSPTSMEAVAAPPSEGEGADSSQDDLKERLTQTDDFELMNVLEEFGESTDDLEAMARRLAALGEETHTPSKGDEGPYEEDEDEHTKQLSVNIDESSDGWVSADDLNTDQANPLAAHAESEVSPAASDAALHAAHGARGSGASFELGLSSVPHEGASNSSLELLHSMPLVPVTTSLTPARLKMPSAEDVAAALHPPDDEPTHPGERPAAVPLEELRRQQTDEEQAVDGASELQEALSVSVSLSESEAGVAFIDAQEQPFAGQIAVHHQPMLQVQQIHALDVSLLQTESGLKGAEAPAQRIRVTPIFPGCIVSPPHATLERWDEQARFWITPMAAGDLRESASLQVQVAEVTISSIALPCVSQKAYAPRLLTIMALVVVMLAMIPPPSSSQGALAALWLFFHHWGLSIAGTLGIAAMITRWWPKPHPPTITRTTFSIES